MVKSVSTTQLGGGGGGSALGFRAGVAPFHDVTTPSGQRRVMGKGSPRALHMSCGEIVDSRRSLMSKAGTRESCQTRTFVNMQQHNR